MNLRNDSVGGPAGPDRPTAPPRREGHPGSGLPTRLSRLTGRHRWPLAAVWLLLLLIAGVQAFSLPGLLSGGGWYAAGSGSAEAAERLADDGFEGRGATSVTVVVTDHRHRAGEPAFEERVGEAVGAVLRDGELRASESYGWTTLTDTATRGAFLGEDGRTALVRVGSDLDDGTARRVLPDIQERLDDRFGPDGLDVSLVSQAALWGEVNHLSERGLILAKAVTLPVILLVLLLIFRSVAAALATLLVGVTAVVFAFGLLAVIARQVELSVFVQSAAAMLGLGVGVDYSLFMIMRFKDELRAEGSPSREGTERALARTLRTSGETVLASGLTIVAAMSTLFLVDLGVIRSMALGAVVVVALAVLTSVLLLPVLLHLLGPRIEWGRVGRPRDGARRGERWTRVTRGVMARPVLFLAVGVGAMLVLALPALRLETFTPDARVVPADTAVRQGYDTARDEFGVGSAAPLQVVVSAPEPAHGMPARATTELLDLHDALGDLPGVVRVDSAVATLRAVNPQDPLAVLAAAGTLPDDARRTVGHFVSTDRTTLLFDVVGNDTASSESVQRLLEEVRAEAAVLAASGDWRVSVGGETAEGVDANKVIEDALVPVIATMLAVIYLLLLLTFRSLFLPLKAIAINLLSVSATYGVLVLIFQDGRLSGLLGLDVDGRLTNFVPVLLVTLLFSLSTDYEVFLLSRVREDYLATGDNTGSVARGMADTMPLISGAAVLMVAVFSAFAFTGIIPIQQLGLGMALAIALDATVVRLLIVPASMRLMSRWNWWLPGRRHDGPAARAVGPHDPADAPQPAPTVTAKGPHPS